MDRQSQYYRQVQLLLRIIPFVSRYDCFALKGGTAINLFVRDFPRLSVDIDLVFLPMMERQMALKTIKSHLDSLAASITANIENTRVVRSFQDKADALRLLVERDGVQIKIELSPVLRGTVYTPRVIQVSEAIEEEFGFAELIRPKFKDISGVYEGEFRNMADQDIPLADLEAAREQLVNLINTTLTPQDRAFLLSFKNRTPNWALLGLTGVDQLPAVRWKLQNLTRMKPEKHVEAYLRLEEILKR
jgi:hypothetical protein